MGGTVVRAVRGFGWTLIWAGAFMLAFVAYQLWGTGVATAASQASGAADLEERFEAERTGPLPDVTIPITGDGTVDEAAVTPAPPSQPVAESAPGRGEPMAVITFPTLATAGDLPTGDIGVESLAGRVVSHVVWSGEDAATLRRGPGHYTATPVPGQPGNAAIAGHRTTHGAPFNRLAELRPGAPIVVETTIGRHVYVVRDPRIAHPDIADSSVGTTGGWMVVSPRDTWVVAPLDGAWLTLTTCHPMFSSRQRLVVVAELVAGPNVGVDSGATA